MVFDPKPHHKFHGKDKSSPAKYQNHPTSKTPTLLITKEVPPDDQLR
jgi:hypothetical protein